MPIKYRHMRSYHILATFFLGAWVLGACTPNVKPLSPTESRIDQQASSLANEGQFSQAAQAWLALAAQDLTRRDHYRLLAAEAYRQENALDSMATVIALITRTKLKGDEPIRLDLLHAEIALRQHHPALALHLTTQTDISPPPALRPRLLELRAQAMAASHNDWGAALTRIQMDHLLQGIDRSQNHQQAIALLEKVGVSTLKQRAAAMLPNDSVLPWINQALVQISIAAAQTRPKLKQAVNNLLPAVDAKPHQGYKVLAKLALLLPEDKPFASISQTIREGFFSAYFNTASHQAARPTVHIYDTTGTAPGALKAYASAVADGAQMVVGPLTRAAVTAVLGQDYLPIPVLALNQPENNQLLPPGGNDFALRPETEGIQVANYLIEHGMTHAYIIISDDDFALRAEAAFRAEFKAREGQVIASTQITRDHVNYHKAILSLGLLPGPGAMPANADTTPGLIKPEHTGIFISMRPEQARLLLPQLRVARIALPVFATSHIYNGSDNPNNNDLNDVTFCDAPWLFNAQSGLPQRTDIAANLPEARGPMARLFAFGMDAWNLVPYLAWMRSHPGSYLHGASGQLTVDPFGHVHRVLAWAIFRHGRARPVHERASSSPSASHANRMHLSALPASTPPSAQNTSSRHGTARSAASGSGA